MELKIKNLLLVITIILFASCKDIDETRTIDGNWEVISIMDQSNFEQIPNFKINLNGLKISGFSGCNKFFGSLKIEENNLTFHQMGGTRMMCEDLTSENLFITTIPKVRAFAFKNDNLQFLSKSDDVLMTLKSFEYTEPQY